MPVSTRLWQAGLFYSMVTLITALLADYSGTFIFGIKEIQHSWFMKVLYILYWLFGPFFLSSATLFYLYRKALIRVYGVFVICLLGDSLLSVVGINSGTFGFYFSKITQNYNTYWVFFSCFIPFLILNIFLFKEEKTKKSKTKGRIREANTQTTFSEKNVFLPPFDLISIGKKQAINIDINSQKSSLMKVLKDFGIDAKIIDIQVGPVVTLYSVELAPGIKSARLINLSSDIARSMQVLSARIATIPGKNLLGIELANPQRQTVYFRESIESKKYKDCEANLPIALGSDIAGEPVVVDLSTMPHLLVAGTTGSGKSVAVHSMLLSLLFKLRPEECRIILIDPKMLELAPYEGIPHLLLPVVTESKEAVNALKWVVKEMESRYKKMAKLGVRNLTTYNAKIAQNNESDSKMPFIVIVIDEMADLMLVAGREIEFCVQRLAQMARASGIHLIMATQRPSVDVITGTIKANFPTRISFKLASKIDSRTILGDSGGAEQLLGQGDMLYLATNSKLTRTHGGFVSENDMQNVVDFWKKQGEPEYIEIPSEDSPGDLDIDDENEPYYKEAVELVRSTQKVSTSYLQRHFPIGYNRAAKIIEKMESDGIISAGDKFGRNREILPK